MVFLNRAPPAVRALCDPRVSAVRPFARLGADAAGGHIVSIAHCRHMLLQGKQIRPKWLLPKLEGLMPGLALLF